MAPPKLLPEDLDPSLPLPDPRHEQFAQYLSDGMTQVAAYEAAGYVAHASNANILSKRPPIQARVEWLIRKKAEDAGLTFAGQIVVDLDRVGPEAKPLTPEWFLYRVQRIAEDEPDSEGNGGSRPSDQLKALELGAKWLGYFEQPKTGKMKTKDPANEAEAVSSDRARRIVAGKESALSRFSSIVDGLGEPSKNYAEDGLEGADQAPRSPEDEDYITE